LGLLLWLYWLVSWLLLLRRQLLRLSLRLARGLDWPWFLRYWLAHPWCRDIYRRQCRLSHRLHHQAL
jgi:hypothetical protein